jgi:hypothetical protein
VRAAAVKAAETAKEAEVRAAEETAVGPYYNMTDEVLANLGMSAVLQCNSTSYAARRP